MAERYRHRHDWGVVDALGWIGFGLTVATVPWLAFSDRTRKEISKKTDGYCSSGADCLCGERSSGRTLPAHKRLGHNMHASHHNHVRNSKYNYPENGELLCAVCHADKDLRMLCELEKIPPEMRTREQKKHIEILQYGLPRLLADSYRKGDGNRTDPGNKVGVQLRQRMGIVDESHSPYGEWATKLLLAEETYKYSSPEAVKGLIVVFSEINGGFDLDMFINVWVEPLKAHEHDEGELRDHHIWTMYNSSDQYERSKLINLISEYREEVHGVFLRENGASGNDGGWEARCLDPIRWMEFMYRKHDRVFKAVNPAAQEFGVDGYVELMMREPRVIAEVINNLPPDDRDEIINEYNRRMEKLNSPGKLPERQFANFPMPGLPKDSNSEPVREEEHIHL